jgi:hypothetical protein
MKISNLFGGLGDMFKDMFPTMGGSDSGSSDGFIRTKAKDNQAEFRSGSDRSRKGMEPRLSYNKTFYRKSMPAPISGSAPGIDELTNKIPPVNASDTIPGTGQGVNFFGYGNKTKVNRFSDGNSSEVNTNGNATGKVKIGGFTTFKQELGESDYGVGNVGEAADFSFYRDKMPTDRYGELYKGLNIDSGNVASITNNNILYSEGDLTNDAADVQEVKLKWGAATSTEPYTQNKTPKYDSPTDWQYTPRAPVRRKLPSVTDTGTDLYLNKYINNPDVFGVTYDAPGERPLGGSLPYGIDKKSSKIHTYSKDYASLRSGGLRAEDIDVAGTFSSPFGKDGVGGDPDQKKAATSQDTTASFESFSNKDGSRGVIKFQTSDLSPLLSAPHQPYKKTFSNRRLIVHAPAKFDVDINADPIKNRKDTTSDIRGGANRSRTNLGDSINAQTIPELVGSNSNSDIDTRYKNRYHPEDILTTTEQLPKDDKQSTPHHSIKNLNTKNTKETSNAQAGGEAGRFQQITDDFKSDYDTALKNLGVKSNAENFNDTKTYDLLSKLAEAGLNPKGKRPVGESTTNPTYEQRFVSNPYYLKSKKVPDYSGMANMIVSERKDENTRIDNYNKQGVLDAENATLDAMPDWAREDFIPLYFHDLVNKKYIPFRSFINSLSDQSDAEWTDTQYLGRADKVYVYKGFTRTMSVDFNVVAFSVDELLPMWQRINYMVGLTKPASYSENGFIIPPFVKFNLGDIYRNQPVLITSVSTSIPAEATWELLNNDRSNGASAKNTYDFANGEIHKENVKVARYPTMCTLQISMTALEKQTPETKQNHFGTLKVNSTGDNKSNAFNQVLSSV